MKLLLSATQFEIQPYLSHFKFEQVDSHLFKKDNQFVLIGGIGLLETTFQLTKFLSNHEVEFVLQAGIAGTYKKSLALGQLVEITSEQYGDLGAEDHQQFLTVSDIQLSLPKQFENNQLTNEPHYPSLTSVSAISVNAAAGSEQTITNRNNAFQPDVESMEGLALFRVCQAFDIKCAQVRAISNYVEPRNRDNWQIDLAIERLNQFLIEQ